MIGLPCGEETMTLRQSVSIDTGTQRTDRGTGRQTELLYQYPVASPEFLAVRDRGQPTLK